MKRFVIAVALLALTVPVQASEFRKSDRKWLPTIDKFAEVFEPCFHAPEDEQGNTDKVKQQKYCKTAQALQKKLEANGYCVRGHVIVGRPSKDGKHCYEIHFPNPPI